jgi:hypothetical protein
MTKEIFDVLEAATSLPLLSAIVEGLQFRRDTAVFFLGRLKNTVEEFKGHDVHECANDFILPTWETVERFLNKLWEKL